MSTDLYTWRNRRDQLTQRNTEQFHEDNDQELESGPVGAGTAFPESDRVNLRMHK